MNNFAALSIAGLLAASVSAEARLILDMPEYASFDLSAPRSSFKLDGTFSAEPLGPTERVLWYNNDFGIQRMTGPDPVGFNSYGDPLRDENHFNFRLSPYGNPDDLNAAFEAAIWGLWPSYNEHTIIEGLQVGQIYEFSFYADYEVADFSGCVLDEDASSRGCSQEFGSVRGTTIMSFFDSGSDAQVPAGPTGALLLTGLAGFALRKKLA